MNQKEGKEARPKCDLASSAKFESGIHQMIILGSCYALRFPNFASPGKLRQTKQALGCGGGGYLLMGGSSRVWFVSFDE